MHLIYSKTTRSCKSMKAKPQELFFFIVLEWIECSNFTKNVKERFIFCQRSITKLNPKTQTSVLTHAYIRSTSKIYHITYSELSTMGSDNS